MSIKIKAHTQKIESRTKDKAFGIFFTHYLSPNKFSGGNFMCDSMSAMQSEYFKGSAENPVLESVSSACRLMQNSSHPPEAHHYKLFRRSISKRRALQKCFSVKIPFDVDFISFISDSLSNETSPCQEFKISNSRGSWINIQSNDSKVIRTLKKSMFKRTKFRKYQSIKQMVETLELEGN